LCKRFSVYRWLYSLVCPAIALEQRKAKANSVARLVTYGEANHTAAAGLTVGLGHTLNLILLLDGIAAKHTSISASLTWHYLYTLSFNAGSCAWNKTRQKCTKSLVCQDHVDPSLRLCRAWTSLSLPWDMKSSKPGTSVYLLDDPLAALISSSAKHSAMVLMFLNEASRAPVLIK